MATEISAPPESATELKSEEKQSPPMLHFSFAKRHGVLIMQYNANEVTIAHQSQVTLSCLLELQRLLTGYTLIFNPVDDSTFEQLLVTQYESQSNAAAQMVEQLDADVDLQDMAGALSKTQDLLDTENDAPIIRLINALLSQAIKESASDIHIETFEDSLSVRFRVDGVLRRIITPQRVIAPLLVSRIKVMAKLDISEKRLPQDGRITLSIGGRAIDVRVSTMPTHHGERVVLRLLDKQTLQLDFSHLGLSEQQLKSLTDIISKPHGILLVTGPTGAGKTTTLYAALTVLNQASRNILTIEDPIEYDLMGIGQTQVNMKVDMTFAKGLRAMLRQDPDVVMVGEIRDLETAEIAVQASLTGHLVLSTLHTNTAIGAITRLRDMGIEPFLLSSSLVGMVAQRLVRLLCKQCRHKEKINAALFKHMDFDVQDDVDIYVPNGCEACNNTGYRGRTGIYEIITLDDTLRAMIHEGASEQQLATYVRQQCGTIRQDGWRRILAGETSLEEVLRVTTEDG